VGTADDWPASHSTQSSRRQPAADVHGQPANASSVAWST